MKNKKHLILDSNSKSTKNLRRNEIELKEFSLSDIELIKESHDGKISTGNWNGRCVAIKRYPVDYLVIGNNEIEVLKRLDHSHIIKYEHYYKNDNFFYLILEYAKLGSLKEWIESNKENPHNWLLNYDFIQQIIEGLHYLHSNKIIHNNLKSSNILITQSNLLKLTDFDLIKFCLNNDKSVSFNLDGVSRITQDTKKDIYMLGCVIWEIVAKKTDLFKKFKDLTPNSISHEKLLGDMSGDTPADLTKIIMFCWDINSNNQISLLKILGKVLDAKEKIVDTELQQVQEQQLMLRNDKIWN